MPRTSIELRQKIVDLNSQNVSISQISMLLRLTTSTVSRVISRYHDRGHNENRKSTGRPKVVTEKMERIVTRASKKHSSTSCTQLKKVEQLEISRHGQRNNSKKNHFS